MSLSADQLEFYRKNGYLAVEEVVSETRVKAMRDRIEQLCADWQSDQARRVGAQQEAAIAGALTQDRNAVSVRKFSDLSPHEPTFAEHASDSSLLDMVESLIGAPILLYADQALLKPPRVGSEKMPHQDNAYFKVDPADAVVTCWCALDDAYIENGCMHYLAGSHRSGLVDHTQVKGTPHLVPDEFDPEKAAAVPIKAGGVIFHHSQTLHYSPVNKTDKWRRAFVCHFVQADAETPHVNAEKLTRLR